MANKKRMPSDQNQRAKSILDQVSGMDESAKEEKLEKNPAAVALGRLGGPKGGKARARHFLKKKDLRLLKSFSDAMD